MLLMKEIVLSLKKHDIGFPAFKLFASTKKSFKTDPINIIFDDFSI